MALHRNNVFTHSASQHLPTGDSTLILASSKFQRLVPPVMAIYSGGSDATHGSGFIAPFDYATAQKTLKHVLHGTSPVTLRMRMKCAINRGPVHQEMAATATKATAATTNSTDAAAPFSFSVLNEVVVDRGPSPYISNLEIYVDGIKITTVQGDGIIVATPTGSTAYSASAGGSMVHPAVPCILITPICPHSLSFRPIIVPSSVELHIKVPVGSRNGAWVSFDGQNRQQLMAQDYVTINSSATPVRVAPTCICISQHMCLYACAHVNICYSALHGCKAVRRIFGPLCFYEGPLMYPY